MSLKFKKIATYCLLIVWWCYLSEEFVKDVYKCLTDTPPLIENTTQQSKKKLSLILISDVEIPNSNAFSKKETYRTRQIDTSNKIITYHIDSNKDILYILDHYTKEWNTIDQLILCAHGKKELSWISLLTWSKYFYPFNIHAWNISTLFSSYKNKITHIFLDNCWWWQLADEFNTTTWASVVWPKYISIIGKKPDWWISPEHEFVSPTLFPENQKFIVVSFNGDTTVVSRSFYEHFREMYEKDTKSKERLKKNVHIIKNINNGFIVLE